MTMAGKIRLIYLDSPYNTGNRDFPYNDRFVKKTDRFRSSTWLEYMHCRLELARDLLAPDGAIFASIDDNEGHHLRLLMNQVFGPERFVASFIWQKVDSPNDNKVVVSPDHEYIHCFATKDTAARWSKMADEGILGGYSKRDEKGRLYRDRILRKNGKNSRRADRPTMFFPLAAPDGTEILPHRADGSEGCWAYGRAGIKELDAEYRLIWKQRTAKDGGRAWVPYSREFAQAEPEKPYPTIWTDVETTRQSKAHHKDMFPGQEPFVTPKPEPLMARIIGLATAEDDVVLDMFLGSGTTAAVAMKMGRRWIGIEKDRETAAGALARLDLVRGGEAGGISSAISWEGTEEGFAVVELKRIPMAELAYELRPEEVWHSLLLLHGLPLLPYDPAKPLQEAASAAGTMAYCDRPTDAALERLATLAEGGEALTAYAYTPGPLRRALDGRSQVEIRPLPEALVRKFAA